MYSPKTGDKFIVLNKYDTHIKNINHVKLFNIGDTIKITRTTYWNVYLSPSLLNRPASIGVEDIKNYLINKAIKQI